MVFIRVHPSTSAQPRFQNAESAEIRETLQDPNAPQLQLQSTTNNQLNQQPSTAMNAQADNADEQASTTPSVQVIGDQPQNLPQPDPTQLNTALLYQDNHPNPQIHQDLLSQLLPPTQGIMLCPAVGNSPTAQLLGIPRRSPMGPLDVARDWILDYVSPQSIKFYYRAIQQLPGNRFNGTMLCNWLQLITDRATSCAWTSILTIKGKLLTEYYAALSLKEVREHAQGYQDEGKRRSQNAEMLLQCLKASITKEVYARVQQLSTQYTITVEPEKLHY